MGGHEGRHGVATRLDTDLGHGGEKEKGGTHRGRGGLIILFYEVDKMLCDLYNTWSDS